MIIKLTASLKAFQVVTDEGHIYQTSVAHAKKLLESGNSGAFILLTRMPFDAKSDRFPKSPVYQGATVLDMNRYDAAVQSRDAYGDVHSKKKEESRAVVDSVVDWNE